MTKCKIRTNQGSIVKKKKIKNRKPKEKRKQKEKIVSSDIFVVALMKGKIVATCPSH